jgi:sulfonate transport system ATP-binding protein
MLSNVEVKNLTKSFGDLLVLDNVSFNVASGEFLCIVGPTGCGKTTFLNSLTKIYEINSGSIQIDGEEVNLQKHSLAYIMQEYSTMSWLSVRQNVQFGLKIKKLKKEELKQKIDDALELVGLTKFQDYYPNQLSASMMQRVSIARAFAVQPNLLLMDEPYGQLDLELRFKLEDELLNLWRKLGTTIIFITHNIEEAVYLSQRILVLTNKPTTIKANIINNLPFPRNVTSGEFITLRNEVTNLIKWW